MNIHHLELFYYVAKHGGISAAARHIPYGIQQPAISAQILQLEGQLGVSLFQRRPFDLTAEGRQLYGFIEPFFGGLPEMAAKLRGDREVELRIGAATAIQHDYLPFVLKKMRRSIPALSFQLVPGCQQELELLLLNEKIDVAIAAVDGKSPPSIKRQELLAMPLALLVQDKSRYQNAIEVLPPALLAEPLVCFEAANPVCRSFQHELQRRKVTWEPALELETFSLVARYVAQGFGVGIVVEQPDLAAPLAHEECD